MQCGPPRHKPLPPRSLRLLLLACRCLACRRRGDGSSPRAARSPLGLLRRFNVLPRAPKSPPRRRALHLPRCPARRRRRPLVCRPRRCPPRASRSPRRRWPLVRAPVSRSRPRPARLALPHGPVRRTARVRRADSVVPQARVAAARRAQGRADRGRPQESPRDPVDGHRDLRGRVQADPAAHRLVAEVAPVGVDVASAKSCSRSSSPPTRQSMPQYPTARSSSSVARLLKMLQHV